MRRGSAVWCEVVGGRAAIPLVLPPGVTPATFRRSSSAALVVVAVLVGLLAAGRWLQPRLDHGTPEAPSTRRPLTSPAPTEGQNSRAWGPAGDGSTSGSGWGSLGGDRQPPAAVADQSAHRPVAGSVAVPARAIAADRSGVWAVCCGAGGRSGQLTRVDPASGRVVEAIRLPSSNGQSYRADTGDPGGDITVTRDAVWVSNPATATVRLIDPRRNQVTDDLVEADGSDLTLAANGVGGRPATPGCSVLAARRCLAHVGTCMKPAPIGSPLWRPPATVGCGWARRRGCSTSPGASCARDSTRPPRCGVHVLADIWIGGRHPPVSAPSAPPGLGR